ncbi:MAG: nucleoside triphosphate pyrophosphohydrolase [Gemmatimonadota bacterium]
MSQKPPPTSASPPAFPSPPGSLDRALDLVRYLRSACPWDGKQTPRSLIPYLLEECYEVVDAIHARDEEGLEGELGDLLLNLAFQLVIGEEEEAFSADSVTRRLEEKMRRRHPHLFDLGPAEPWETLKARERQERGDGSPEPSVLDGLESGIEPLLQAYRIQARVARVGFDWAHVSGALEKAEEELEEVKEALDSEAGSEAVEEEVGDLLFAAVNVARLAGIHPSAALRRANRKFQNRFLRVEAMARAEGLVMEEAGLEALDTLWDRVKAEQSKEKS